MGLFILRGITTALLVTILTFFAGIVWGVMDLGGLSISRLLDIGLLISCLVGGYRTAKESGEWWLGGIVGAGYVTVGILLLALFLPIRGWGYIQVLAEGTIIGLVAGAVGAGGMKGKGISAWPGKRSQVTSSYAGYESNGGVSNEFDWGKEVNFEEWKDQLITNGIESSKKSPDDQWSWDREDEKTMISSGPRYSEPFSRPWWEE